MKLRIISGEFGGRQLDTPDNSRTHPMSERVRNAMFNSIGDEIKDAVVLDAFAGTGSVGLEALSRGARSVTFVERDRIAQKIIGNNIKKLGVDEKTTLIKSPLNSWIESGITDKFDIIFADPPYNNLQLSTVSKLFGLLKSKGLMVLSYTGIGEVTIQDKIVVVDNRVYGKVNLTYFRLEE